MAYFPTVTLAPPEPTGIAEEGSLRVSETPFQDQTIHREWVAVISRAVFEKVGNREMGTRFIRETCYREEATMVTSFFPRVSVAIRAAAYGPLPARLEEAHSFVLDLGFDSLAMARLGLTLEEQFDCPILLDTWLSSRTDPGSLTIGSLCEFVRSRLQADEHAAA